jgi:hypothetical protein
MRPSCRWRCQRTRMQLGYRFPVSAEAGSPSPATTAPRNSQPSAAGTPASRTTPPSSRRSSGDPPARRDGAGRRHPRHRRGLGTAAHRRARRVPRWPLTYLRPRWAGNRKAGASMSKRRGAVAPGTSGAAEGRASAAREGTAHPQSASGWFIGECVRSCRPRSDVLSRRRGSRLVRSAPGASRPPFMACDGA